jgi:hypothetical protein
MIESLPKDYQFTADQEKMIEEIGLLRFRRRHWEVQKTSGKTPRDREVALKMLLKFNKDETILMGRLEKSINSTVHERNNPTEAAPTESQQ